MGRIGKALVAAALSLLAGTVHADSEPVAVVKVLSFACPICRASEQMDPDIRRAVVLAGGKFGYAAMPPDPNNLSRELAYYAARDLGMEGAARASLYKGSQDYGLTFSDPTQAAVWLQDDAGIDGSRLAAGMNGDAARQALGRAVHLAARAGVQKLPAYVLLRNGEVLSVVSANGVPTLFAVKKKVIDEVASYNNPQAETKQ